MKPAVMLVLVGALLLGIAGTAVSDEPATKEQAVAMVKQAIAYFQAEGKEKAFAEINNKKGKFVDRDLYVVVYDMKGKCLAHGSNAKLIGRDLLEAKDVDGVEYVKERIALLEKAPSGWQDYKFRNPTTNQIEPKSMYVERLDDLIFGCGVYKK